MNTTIKELNKKTDNRFLYALGLICLLSICMSEFPEPVSKTYKSPDKVTIADKVQTIDIHLKPFCGKL